MKTVVELLQDYATRVIMQGWLDVDADLQLDKIIRLSADGNRAFYAKGFIKHSEFMAVYNLIDQHKGTADAPAITLLGETSYDGHPQMLFSFVLERSLHLVYFEEDAINDESCILVYGAAPNLNRKARDHLLSVLKAVPTIAGVVD